jgi:hypothetical protein
LAVTVFSVGLLAEVVIDVLVILAAIPLLRRVITPGAPVR